jgi:hypothetical protein
MTDEIIDLDEFEPPERDDFRRVGRWHLPHVMGIDGNKRVIYRRSSSAGKVLDDESNLTDWKLRTVVAGAAQRPELMAQASVLSVDVDKGELRDIAEQCLVAGKGQRRSITGVAVHAMFDRIDKGEQWNPAPQFEDLCNAYRAMLDEWGLVPVDIEFHCVNDQWKLAGRGDRRYRTTKPLIAPDGMVIPISSHIVGDFKTGHELEYAAGSYVTQMAAYVDSMRYDVHTDERTPFDPPSLKDWALIIHADSAGTRVDVYWADLSAGRVGLALANDVRDWRRRDGLLILGQPIRTVESEPEPVPEPAPLGSVAAVEPRDAHGRAEYLRGRVRALVAYSDVAAKALQRAWPQGIPGLKHEGHTWEQLILLESIVSNIENDHMVPFYPPYRDPTIEESRQHHPANVPIGGGIVRAAAQMALDERAKPHPRTALIRQWIALAVEGGIDHSIDTTALAKALETFANVSETEWPDKELTEMLDGSLRAMGYMKGCKDLGRFQPKDAPMLLTAAFAIAAGNATLLFDDAGNPVVRTNIVTR